MKAPPLGPGGEDITWPDQVAPRGRKASSTRNLKPQASNVSTRFALQQCTSPSRPCQGNAWRPWQATVAQRHCVRLHFHRGANRARDFFAMAPQ